MTWLDIALRAAAVSQLLFIGALLVRGGWPLTLPRAIALLLTTGIAAYMYCSLPGGHPLSPFDLPLMALCIANPAVFWLFANAIFRDGFRLRLWHVAIVVGFVALSLWSRDVAQLASTPNRSILTVTNRLIAFCFIAAGLWVAFRGRGADLVENRRRFRDWFTLLSGVYMLIVVGAEIALAGSEPSPTVSALNVAAILAIAHIASHALVRVKGRLLDAVARGPADVDPTTEADRRLLERLTSAMEQEHLYRQEGLTIARLAEKLATQEHVLRKSINQGLGFRNFNEFLHSYRIRDACERLRQNEGRKLPILTIAMDVGYGSVAPFNRAFRELTGMTPSEYRSAQQTGSPGNAAKSDRFKNRSEESGIR